jgi:hypothetical protein
MQFMSDWGLVCLYSFRCLQLHAAYELGKGLVAIYIDDEVSLRRYLQKAGSVGMMLQQAPTLALDPSECQTVRGMTDLQILESDSQQVLRSLRKHSHQLDTLLGRIYSAMADQHLNRGGYRTASQSPPPLRKTKTMMFAFRKPPTKRPGSAPARRKSGPAKGIHRKYKTYQGCNNFGPHQGCSNFATNEESQVAPVRGGLAPSRKAADLASIAHQAVQRAVDFEASREPPASASGTEHNQAGLGEVANGQCDLDGAGTPSVENYSFGNSHKLAMKMVQQKAALPKVKVHAGK